MSVTVENTTENDVKRSGTLFWKNDWIETSAKPHVIVDLSRPIEPGGKKDISFAGPKTGVSGYYVLAYLDERLNRYQCVFLTYGDDKGSYGMKLLKYSERRQRSFDPIERRALNLIYETGLVYAKVTGWVQKVRKK